jgi:hypothetical protein
MDGERCFICPTHLLRTALLNLILFYIINSYSGKGEVWRRRAAYVFAYRDNKKTHMCYLCKNYNSLNAGVAIKMVDMRRFWMDGERCFICLPTRLLHFRNCFFYIAKRIPFNHATWHLFVLAGAVSYFFAMLMYVLPQ